MGSRKWWRPMLRPMVAQPVPTRRRTTRHTVALFVMCMMLCWTRKWIRIRSSGARRHSTEVQAFMAASKSALFPRGRKKHFLYSSVTVQGSRSSMANSTRGRWWVRGTRKLETLEVRYREAHSLMLLGVNPKALGVARCKEEDDDAAGAMKKEDDEEKKEEEDEDEKKKLFMP